MFSPYYIGKHILLLFQVKRFIILYKSSHYAAYTIYLVGLSEDVDFFWFLYLSNSGLTSSILF